MGIQWRKVTRGPLTVAAFVLVTTLLGSLPLVHEGFFVGHDLRFEFVRLAEYRNSLEASGFPVRWAGNLNGGLGSPIFLFFPPLFLTIVTVLSSLALGLEVGAKAGVLMLTIAGGTGMYLIGRRLLCREGALLASGLFLLAPYRFTDIFIRNAFSEFTALMVAPFILHSVLIVLDGTGSRLWRILYLAVTSTAMLLAHVLSLIMYVPLFIFFLALEAWRAKHWRMVPDAVAGAVLGAMLASFQLAPLLFERNYIQGWRLTVGKLAVLRNLIPATDLLRFGGWLSLTPAALLLVALSATILTIRKDDFEPCGRRHLPWMLVATVLLFILITPESAVVWRSFPFLKIFQFPWRLLSPLTLLLSLASGSLVMLLPSRGALRIAAVAVALTVAGMTLLFQYPPEQWKYASIPEEKLSGEGIRINRFPADVIGEYATVWTPFGREKFTPTRRWELPDPAKVIEETESPEIAAAAVDTASAVQVRLNIFWFPGWRILIDGREIGSRASRDGVIEFDVPAGRHRITAEFGATKVRLIGNLLSILGLALAAVLAAAPLIRRARLLVGARGDAET